MGNKLDNQNGLTLLEVLISIVILSIILTSFAGFFSQSALFVKKNEEKLSTSQTAQQIVNLIEVTFTQNKLATINGCESLTCNLVAGELSSILGEPISSTYNISAEFEKFEENLTDSTGKSAGKITLVKVKLMVVDPDDHESSSETYTYIRR